MNMEFCVGGSVARGEAYVKSEVLQDAICIQGGEAKSHSKVLISFCCGTVLLSQNSNTAP